MEYMNKLAQGWWEEESSYSLQPSLRGVEDGGRKSSYSLQPLREVEEDSSYSLLPPLLRSGGWWEEESSYSLQPPLRGVEDGRRKSHYSHRRSLLITQWVHADLRNLFVEVHRNARNMLPPLWGVEDGGRKSHLTPSNLLSEELRMVGGRVILLPPTSSPRSWGWWEEESSYSLQPSLRRSGGWWEEESSYSLQPPLQGVEDVRRKSHYSHHRSSLITQWVYADPRNLFAEVYRNAGNMLPTFELLHSQRWVEIAANFKYS